eukprot:gene14757-biopygen21671
MQGVHRPCHVVGLARCCLCLRAAPTPGGTGNARATPAPLLLNRSLQPAPRPRHARATFLFPQRSQDKPAPCPRHPRHPNPKIAYSPRHARASTQCPVTPALCRPCCPRLPPRGHHFPAHVFQWIANPPPPCACQLVPPWAAPPPRFWPGAFEAWAAARGLPAFPGITGSPVSPALTSRGVVQHVFGKLGTRSFQRGAGPRPARHARRLASAGETALPVIQVTPAGGGPAPPPPPQRPLEPLEPGWRRRPPEEPRDPRERGFAGAGQSPFVACRTCASTSLERSDSRSFQR